MRAGAGSELCLARITDTSAPGGSGTGTSNPTPSGETSRTTAVARGSSAEKRKQGALPSTWRRGARRFSAPAGGPAGDCPAGARVVPSAMYLSFRGGENAAEVYVMAGPGQIDLARRPRPRPPDLE